MMPELKAALARVRKYHDAASGLVIYPADADASVAADLELLARAFVAEHPADDDEPVTAEELDALPRDLLDVFVCEGEWVVYVRPAIAIKTHRQLRELLKGLGNDA